MRIAINGYGRIGRCVLRAWCERRAAGDSSMSNIDIVALNELAAREAVAYLTRYDSTHGRFPGEVELDGNKLLVNGFTIEVLRESSFSSLPWAKLGIDFVLECSGTISTFDSAQVHLHAGARSVLLSNPGDTSVPALVYGVNHLQAAGKSGGIWSAASCTSNALIPVLSVLHDAFHVESGVVTTIHAAMHDQPVIDAFYSDDLRRNRAASESMIPVATALASGVDRVLPALRGKIAAHALRIPVTDVSALNVTLGCKASPTVIDVNAVLAATASSGPLHGVLGYTEEPVASCDFTHDAHSCVVDGLQTLIAADGDCVNVLLWFDNEWAFANRMLDLASYLDG